MHRMPHAPYCMRPLGGSGCNRGACMLMVLPLCQPAPPAACSVGTSGRSPAARGGVAAGPLACRGSRCAACLPAYLPSPRSLPTFLLPIVWISWWDSFPPTAGGRFAKWQIATLKKPALCLAHCPRHLHPLPCRQGSRTRCGGVAGMGNAVPARVNGHPGQELTAVQLGCMLGVQACTQSIKDVCLTTELVTCIKSAL